MANKQFTDLNAIASVDGSADLLAIYDDSATELKKTTRNTLLNLTSAPVGLTDTQTITNKTITQPVLTVDDDEFTLQDNADTTKKVQFQLSGITTNTTRTFTIPDVSDTLVTLGATQTLTNKTLTGPTINSATITNPTLTVDTVSEFTSANGVTVDGLNIKDGSLNTANSVDSDNYTDGSIHPEHLVPGTGSSWTWQSWTPTWTNLTIGNGTVSARYIQIGKMVRGRIFVTLGTTSSVSGGVQFTLPVTSVALDAATANKQLLGEAVYIDASGGTSGVIKGTVAFNSTTDGYMYVEQASGSYVNRVNISSTVPFTWADADEISITFSYEAA